MHTNQVVLENKSQVFSMPSDSVLVLLADMVCTSASVSCPCIFSGLKEKDCRFDCFLRKTNAWDDHASCGLRPYKMLTEPAKPLEMNFNTVLLLLL